MISEKIQSGINGEINIPGDKSISHRALMLAAIINGKSRITNISSAEDVMRGARRFGDKPGVRKRIQIADSIALQPMGR